MLTGSSCNNIRPLKTVRSRNPQLPVLARSRSNDRNEARPLSVAEYVLNLGGQLPAQLNIHEIRQFDCDRYLTAILAGGRPPECGANRSKASRTQFIEERERSVFNMNCG
jgi:hypothetical protein